MAKELKTVGYSEFKALAETDPEAAPHVTYRDYAVIGTTEDEVIEMLSSLVDPGTKSSLEVLDSVRESIAAVVSDVESLRENIGEVVSETVSELVQKHLGSYTMIDGKTLANVILSDSVGDVRPAFKHPAYANSPFDLENFLIRFASPVNGEETKRVTDYLRRNEKNCEIVGDDSVSLSFSVAELPIARSLSELESQVTLVAYLADLLNVAAAREIKASSTDRKIAIEAAEGLRL